MTKTELIRDIAARAGITQVRATIVLDTLLASLTDVMVANDAITLAGLGTFKLSQHKERAGRNPATGEKLLIPARKMPRFVPGKELREKVAALKTARKK